MLIVQVLFISGYKKIGGIRNRRRAVRRLEGMEEDRTGSQGAQRTVVLEKNKKIKCIFYSLEEPG
jgi:hypothetical protein